MVEKLSRHIALWLIKSGILENDDIDLYIYAIQYLLLIINPTIIFTAYCIATHNITIGLIEVFSFLLIRKYCGGYHCQSSTVCLIFSAIILIVMAWLSSFIKIITYIYKQSYAAIGSSTFNIRKICLRHAQLFSHFRLFYTHFFSSLLKPGSNIYNSFFHNFLTRTLSNY
jgi:accessory gene regulator protein AgrB